ncbi:DNA (cytosine-5)-methyltransferase CMT3-like protein [Tanacetum coccineum]
MAPKHLVVYEGEEVLAIWSRSNLEKKEKADDDVESKFTGEAVADEDSIVTVPSKGREPPKVFIQAKRHFTAALVDGYVKFKLGDDGHVYAGKDVENHICRIVEMFEGLDGEPYFCARWFYRAKDTMIQACSTLIDDRRVFFSEIKDDNSLDCLTQKVKIVRVPLDVDGDAKRGMLSDGNYYYDMMYNVPFSTFQKLPNGIK